MNPDRLIQIGDKLYDRQKVFCHPQYFAGLIQRELFESMFGEKKNEDQDILNLAMKMAAGKMDFSAEELQLQANEPEKLEKMLRDVREFMEKKIN